MSIAISPEYQFAAAVAECGLLPGEVVPEWLLPLHRARAQGLIPRDRWIVIQAGGRVAPLLPSVTVPPGYRPSPSHNMSACHGLDCELLIDDDAGYRLVYGLVAGILAANPRTLWILTCGRYPSIVILKGAAHGVR